MQRWSDLTPDEQARYEDREKLLAQLATANEARQQLQDALHVRDTQLAAATERAEAAESALALATNSTPGKATTVLMTLDKWTGHLSDVERFGADQWRNGNAGREPQEFEEWRREQSQG